jgi:Zn-dependent protease with chaperone function
MARPAGRAARRAEGETFYEAQRRHRRAGWRFTALAVLSLVVTSLPVAVVLSLPVAALALILNDLLRIVLPLPDLVADVVDLFGHMPPGDAFVEPSQPLTAGLVLTVVGLAVVPGSAVVVAAWLVVWRLLLRVGPEAAVLATGARPPRDDDPEERQLVNLVEELAIAAGIPPPRVRVVDRDVVNAAVVGRGVDDAVVVVPRTLLAQLGRRPTGAIVAGLVAMAVNGDMRFAQTLAATTTTLDLLGAVLAAPTSPRARRVLRSMKALARRPRTAQVRAGAPAGPDVERREDARMVVDELLALGQLEDVDPETKSTNSSGWQAAALPLLLARTALAMMQLVVLGLLISPVMALAWRRRRLLADATAVELTRDPDALIAALEHLQAHGASVAAGPWSHLFVVGPELEKDRSQRLYEQRLAAAGRAEARADEGRLEAFARRRRTRSQAQVERMGEARAQIARADPASRPRAGTGAVDLVAYLPPVEQRLARLVALGGTRTTTPYSRPPLRQLSGLGRFIYVLLVLLVPLVAALAVVVLACSLAMALIATALELVVVGPLVALVHAIVS